LGRPSCWQTSVPTHPCLPKLWMDPSLLSSTTMRYIFEKLNDKVVFVFWTRRFFYQKENGPLAKGRMAIAYPSGYSDCYVFKKTKRVHMKIGVKTKLSNFNTKTFFKSLSRIWSINCLLDLKRCFQKFDYLVSKSSELFVDFETVEKNAKNGSLQSYWPLKCRKGIVFTPLVLFGKGVFGKLLLLSVTFPDYINGF
jgi:hypothetical protein